jgi:hypothetical protein
MYPIGTLVEPSIQLTFTGFGKDIEAEKMPVWVTY